MTEEELEKKANLYADEHYDDTDEYGFWFSDVEMLKRAFIAGAKEMQKENAELKEKLEINQNAGIDWFGKAVTKDRQLTEAKEIIRMYYLYNPSSKYSYEEIEQKAETFFKELAE